MIFEIIIQRIIIDKRGNDKSVLERYYVENVELFGEAEMKGLELYTNNADVVAIKYSSILEFVNRRTLEEQSIFVATLESVFVDENEVEKTTRYKVALFARNIQDATNIVLEYQKGNTEDMTLIGMKRTKFIDILS